MKTRRFRGLALALLTSASCLSFGENYLILHSVDSASAADVRAQILGTGLVSGNVDIRLGSSSTPSVSLLQSYDAVLVFASNGFQNGILLGNNLATYADGGGGVVVAPLTSSASGPFVIGGRFATSSYSPFVGGAIKQYITRRLGTLHDDQHPLLTDVTNFHGGSASLHNQVSMSPAAVRIADYDNGVPLVAFKQVGTSYVVGLNFFPPSGAVNSGNWVTTTDGAKLMANALKFSAGNRNSAPIALGEAFTLEAGTSLSVPAPGLLENDSDPDGDPVTVEDSSLVEPDTQPVSGPSNGTLSLSSDGSFTYAPAPSFTGTDTFTYRVTDGHTASNLVSVTLTVVDTTAPEINDTPNDTIVSATGPSGAPFSYISPTAFDAVDGTLSIAASHPTHAVLPLGETVVTFTATDAAGNTTQTSFKVSVVDVTPPVISGTPANQVVIASSASGASFTYALPSAVDAVDGAVVVTANIASGSVFSLGQTTVTFTATDAAGNQSQSSFKVWTRFSASNLVTTGNENKGLKAGSAVKVRFRLTGQSAPVKDAVAKLAVSNKEIGNLTYDPTSGLYEISWKTKGLRAGNYQLTLDLRDDVSRTLNVRLR